MDKTRVLFMCTGNTARRRIAEAFLRAWAGDHFEAYSAGLEPPEIDPLTLAVMEERGFDPSDHYAKGREEFLGKVHFGCLIAARGRAEAECPTFPEMGVRESWPFEEPAASEGTEDERLAKLREVRDAIGERVQEWIGGASPQTCEPAPHGRV
jgi:arsenate reductase